MRALYTHFDDSARAKDILAFLKQSKSLINIPSVKVYSHRNSSILLRDSFVVTYLLAAKGPAFRKSSCMTTVTSYSLYLICELSYIVRYIND